jgi:NADPH-dependent 2,4-dienoyl-CoA reductase/sulfur reductase-like enzyme
MGERLLVIGGNAAGMSAASQARRRMPGLEIVAIEKGRWTSYSGCGIPYFAAGAVHGLDDLVVRTPENFRAARIDVRTEHEVTSLDVEARRAEVHNLAHGRTFQLAFDMLLIATGSSPIRPDSPGFDLPHVHGVQTLGDASDLIADVKRRNPKKAVVVGGGYIGLELAEALTARGVAVTVVDAGPEVMGTLDPDMGSLVAKAMRAIGITVQVGTKAESIDEISVQTSAGAIPADLVVLGLGVQPNSGFAASAGLRTGVSGALVVDRQQRTDLPGIWAAGDCCQSIDLVSGRPVYVALGTVANKQGRVAGINISGGYATFPGVLGTAVTRICHQEIGRTGLTEHEARDAGFSTVAATIEATTAASYMPESAPVTVKMVAELGSARLLGVQIVGGRGSAKRVDVAAAALAGGLAIDDLVGLDMGYAPPLSPLWDPLQVAARTLLTKL